MSETPTTPIKAIEEVDERLLEKLSLLEESGSKSNMDAFVSDLWSIMDQNGGWAALEAGGLCNACAKKESHFAKFCSRFIF